MVKNGGFLIYRKIKVGSVNVYLLKKAIINRKITHLYKRDIEKSMIFVFYLVLLSTNIGLFSTQFSTIILLHHCVIALFCNTAIVLLCYCDMIDKFCQYKNQKPDKLIKMGWNEKMKGGGVKKSSYKVKTQNPYQYFRGIGGILPYFTLTKKNHPIYQLGVYKVVHTITCIDRVNICKYPNYSIFLIFNLFFYVLTCNLHHLYQFLQNNHLHHRTENWL